MKTKKHSSQHIRDRHRTQRRLGFQPLENRLVMTANAVLASGGELRIDAGAKPADVEIISAFNRVFVGSRDSSGIQRFTNFDASAVKRIVFNGSDLADKFVNRTNIVDWIYGKGGNDTLTGGRGASRIEGGSGDDTIQGSDGSDTIYGGSGKDSINAGSGDDTVYGDADNDTLRGGTGKDTIRGGAGNDTMYGVDGNDTMYGDIGNDTMFGDDFMGGQGIDFLYGGEGYDKLYGGGGNDTLDGQAGNDELYGGNGDDTLFGGSGADKLFGGGGVDYLVGGLGPDYLDGGPMRDRLGALVGDDTVPELLHAELRIDDIFCRQASDGQPWGTANEVYVMVQGIQGGVEFGPYKVHPNKADNWQVDTGGHVKNVLVWQNDLKPGESVDLVVSLYDQDCSGWDALLAFGMGLLEGLPTAIPSMFAGNFEAAVGAFVNGIRRAVNAGGGPVDDLLGMYYVHVENVNGKIVTTWRAASHAISDGLQETSAGDTARFKTWSTDGEFSIRTSVLET